MYKLDKEKDGKKIEELKGQCPGNELLELSFTVNHKLIVIYGKPPSRAIYKQFKSRAKSDYLGALEVLVCDSVIHPDPVSFQKLLDRYPGLCDNVGQYLFESIGQTQDAEIANL